MKASLGELSGLFLCGHLKRTQKPEFLNKYDYMNEETLMRGRETLSSIHIYSYLNANDNTWNHVWGNIKTGNIEMIWNNNNIIYLNFCHYFPLFNILCLISAKGHFWWCSGDKLIAQIQCVIYKYNKQLKESSCLGVTSCPWGKARRSRRGSLCYMKGAAQNGCAVRQKHKEDRTKKTGPCLCVFLCVCECVCVKGKRGALLRQKVSVWNEWKSLVKRAA